MVFEKSHLYREVLGELATVLAAPPAGEVYEVGIQA